MEDSPPSYPGIQSNQGYPIREYAKDDGKSMGAYTVPQPNYSGYPVNAGYPNYPGQQPKYPQTQPVFQENSRYPFGSYSTSN